MRQGNASADGDSFSVSLIQADRFPRIIAPRCLSEDDVLVPDILRIPSLRCGPVIGVYMRFQVKKISPRLFPPPILDSLPSSANAGLISPSVPEGGSSGALIAGGEVLAA